MLKRLILALTLAGLLSPAFGAGTLPGFSLSQQMGKDGKPLAGCILKFYQAGTVATPQTAYQDSGLTIPVVGGSQMTCDTFGRIGQFFLADGSIKILLTNSLGVTQVTADGLLVIGASSGGGGGSPVDPTTILATGDFKLVYNTGVLTGFVRCNGRTIGSATSGATERANADTSALFSFLWGADSSLAVSGGRGASAAADFAANKTIAVPDCRNRGVAGLGDMGNSDVNLFSGLTFGRGNGTTLGSFLGAGSFALRQTDLPNITPTFSGATSTLDQGNILQFTGSNLGSIPNSGGSGVAFNNSGPTKITPTVIPQGIVSSINGNVSQTSTPTTSPLLLTTIYIKL